MRDEKRDKMKRDAQIHHEAFLVSETETIAALKDSNAQI